MAMTAATAQTHLDKWLAADLAVTESQAASVDTTAGSRSVTMVDPDKIRENIKYWQNIVNKLTATEAGYDSGTIKLATWS